MINTQHLGPEVLGHLFGWPVKASLFLTSRSGHNICTHALSDAEYSTGTLQGSVSNTFSLASNFHIQTVAVVSPAVAGPTLGQQWIDRVEAYLCKAELKADTITEREEYQLSRRIIHRAFYENCTNPYFLAFCWFYGGSPEVIARKQENYRRFMLRGTATYEIPKVLPPKKPAASVVLKAKGVAGGR